jgi:hypothetical protein
LETSGDLLTWSSLAESINGGPLIATTPAAVVIESGDFLRKAEVTLATSQGPRFFRLSARLTTAP